MAPIYDSDVAEERYSKSEWNHYELWEKVEVRLRRNRRLWIAGTVVVFLLISSIPVVQQQQPRWSALAAARRLADEVNGIKKRAGIEHSAFRIRFVDDTSLRYVVEKGDHCLAERYETVAERSLAPPGGQAALQLVSSEAGKAAGIPGLVTRFCYDPISGAQESLKDGPLVGFGFVPSDDLRDGRMDRISVLLLHGPLAEISID